MAYSADNDCSGDEDSVRETFKRISELISQDDVKKMMSFQITAIDRLESTNVNLTNCNSIAQSKLNSMTKLYKKTAQQLKESKKDLDVIHRKITDLKTKIRAERPDLYAAERQLIEQELQDDEQRALVAQAHLSSGMHQREMARDI